MLIISDHGLHEPPTITPDMLQSFTGSSIDNDLLGFDSSVLITNPSSLPDFGWLEAPDGATASFTTWPPLVAIEANPELDLTLSTDLASPKHNEIAPALSKALQFASGLIESHDTLPPASASNGDQPSNTVGAGISPTTEASAFFHTHSPLGLSARTSREESDVSRQAAIPSTPPTAVAQRPQHSKSSVRPVCTWLDISEIFTYTSTRYRLL